MFTETSKDGAQTTYTYGPNNSWIQATTNGRFVKTYFDGIGRTVKVEAGHGSTVLSIVETEYRSCACSPVGKVSKTSLPYAPGGTKYWTEYTYDGLGRTLSVKQPNNSGTTTYVYEANTVQVTSPSGKWKKYEMDGLGRLVKVIEPRPAGGTYETTYLYNAAGKLKQVIMPRDGVTQNRYFNYDTTTGTRLLSTQNPENGTVTYTYNTDGTVASKVDANDIRTEYTYDQYKRPTQMRKVNNSTSEERRCERVDYFYDEGGGANTGRLTRMRWNWDASANPCTVPGTSKKAAFEETYAYTAAGRVAGKNINYRYDFIGNVNLDASWTYDNEGRLTSQTYPARTGQTGTRRVMTYSYDSMGRLEGVAQNWDNNPLTSTDIATSAQYNFQGALTSLNILGQTETRQYNTLGQLTRIQGAGINIEYQFSATANDGKITGQKNWTTGEEVTYQYDALERLISAATVSNAWGLSWSYDGFGNRLNQNVTKGTAPSMSTLVDANTNRLSGFGYSYDNNGNLLTMPQQSTSMAYDASNRMVTFTNQNDTESYQYAPDNKRVWRSNACQDGQGAKHPSFYYYSAFGQLLGEYCTISGSVTVKQENFHFGGRIVAKGDTPGAITSLTTDRLHSKGDGSTFFPYGETKSGNPITGDSFATYSRDWTGLDYADQRWYAPGVGRFTTVDPYMRRSSNYEYADADPVNMWDPNGLQTITVTAPPVPLEYCEIFRGHPSCRAESAPLERETQEIPRMISTGTEIITLRDAYIDAFKRGVYSDCEALSFFAETAIGIGVDGIEEWAFGALFPHAEMAASLGVMGWGESSFHPREVYDPKKKKTGFKDQFSESTTPGSDQTHHFAAFFEFGQKLGGMELSEAALQASLASFAYEVYGWRRDGQLNVGDFNLGYAAALIGHGASRYRLTQGRQGIHPSSIGTEIRKLCK